MSEPTWELLGGGGVIGGPIDYVGPWSAGVTYQPGQIVSYNGVDYLCVNPALGQTPPVSFPYPKFYGCRVETNLSTSIPHNGGAYLPWNLEIFDVGGFHDNVTNNTRLLAPVVGKYLAVCQMAFQTGTANSQRAGWIRRSDGVIVGTHREVSNPVGGEQHTLQVVGVADMPTPGMYLEVAGYQASGAAINVTPGDGGLGGNSYFSMIYLGP